MNTSHIAYFTLAPESRHAAAQVLGLTTGALYGSTRIAKALADAYRPGEPHRARLNLPDDRKVLTVSYAGEGTYVATLTDDETVPTPTEAACAAAQRLGMYPLHHALTADQRAYRTRLYGAVLDREAEELDR